MFKGKNFLSRPEKRNYQRLDCDLQVDLTIEGQKLQAKATNISCGGMFLPIDQNLLRERTDIEVLLSLPDMKKPVRVIGEVARAQENTMLSRKISGVAIRFTGLYDDNILAIDRFIKERVQ